jgi:hypothetical protein
MRAGEGARELPAWEGEPADKYVARLAVRLKYIEPDAAPALKPMPRASDVGYEERLREIWRKPGPGPREPGEDGEA